ncbi:hypothetical protein KFL_000800130 [Klebsormidium nitens]|uniref:Uncharacterized protein n=1 Tax=Klebsormidium nitens TaxID=105231 RepID=A0A1Y1HS23_KLENI|nr:hypothetical protein KFL_000800130 [Klebsormidium nitens]|eukprot:GAQ81435.1 hypothetical protein KFL_000800130 [Klebsormidium nitens]
MARISDRKESNASISYGKESNGRLTKGIPYAEAAERRRKLNKPTPFEDQLLDATNEFLNVLAYPIGLGVLAASLPAIWTYRLVSDALSQPADMTDKVVLITGASSGLGEDMAYEYARLGARLALVARRKEKLKDVAANAWALGAHDVLVVDADLGNEDGCKDALSRTLGHYRRLDTLVNNAGLFPSFYFESADSTAGFDSIMDTNFWSYVYMTYHALPHLRASQGNIYVTASVSSIAPVPMNSFYNASKSAVASFYHTLRIELGHEVPITIFSPGLAKSEMTDGKFVQPDGSVADYEEGIRLRRQNGFGLVPLMPTSAIAKAAVDATRRRKPDVIHPVWYGLIAYYRLLAPELLDPLLRTVLLGDDNAPTKIIQDALGGGIGEPNEGQLRAGGMRAPGRRDSVEAPQGMTSMLTNGTPGRKVARDPVRLGDNLDHIVYLGIKHLTRRLWFF